MVDELDVNQWEMYFLKRPCMYMISGSNDDLFVLLQRHNPAVVVEKALGCRTLVTGKADRLVAVLPMWSEYSTSHSHMTHATPA